MSLVANPNPHHVRYPRGVQCLDCEEFTAAELERCLACGSSAVALREDGEWEGGPPEPGHPHHVEIACDGSGMVGYTRLTAAQIKEKAKADVQWHAEQKKLRDKEAADLAVLQAKAKEDPAFAILLRRQGIHVEP